MTKPRYHHGCGAGSQAHGDAAEGSFSAAWNVNFNNGNVNNNHRNNNGFALACRRAGEFQGEQAVDLQALYRAWRRARRQKVPSFNQLHFERDWMCGLLQLQRELQGGTWSPRPSTCFIATRPKAREIHAPDFADRVVHHWLVPQLEAIHEPAFIHDSYANRKGKGSHAAVRRAQAFARQVHSGQGDGWYLQLDISNFFNRIHRPTLWRLLRERMQRAGLPMPVQRATHALLRHSPLHAGVRYRATAAERAQVPAHKRLENAPPGRGLPIGNLSSQFFANVYLDRLDQFAKHILKAQRYLRYVDDFVFLHRDRGVLEQWLAQVERFIADELQLSLKPDIRLRRLTDGLDFLGYIIRPTHTLARRRVVAHARQALAEWEGTHVRGRTLRGTPDDFRQIRSRVASYTGHLQHASSHRLHTALRRRFPWIDAAARPRTYSHRLEGRSITHRY
ncbi:RNA-directed DNA polymerase [Marilutibacter alkalisoli]|uniref:Reverse transcriptase n=1 Tax=Marilutibacter alkalisoli TaxID=2591633 RepID=A0A514BU33_9GAMM|nr:reverse transcriptase domain-containing protein [Lysobacter alkalisoli]QDH70882.1 reverse transcriptase [Lysobacter alkalisoli]